MLHFQSAGIKPKERQSFSFPPTVLAYLRALLPSMVKGDILDGTYKVTIKEFCKATSVSPLQ